jgi:hypothetical protein
MSSKKPAVVLADPLHQASWRRGSSSGLPAAYLVTGRLIFFTTISTTGSCGTVLMPY